MITRCSIFPPEPHDPAAPPPLHAVSPADRAAWSGRAVTPGGPLAAGTSEPAQAAAGPRGYGAARGGLLGGAVVFTGLPSTPGGSSGYGYLGMDITDPASWPRPFNPQPSRAWFCYPAAP